MTDRKKRLDSRLLGFAKAPDTMKNDPGYPFFIAGVERGKMAMEYMILTFLEKMYMEDPRPARNTPEAKAILEVTKLVATFIRGVHTEDLKDKAVD